VNYPIKYTNGVCSQNCNNPQEATPQKDSHFKRLPHLIHPYN
jgi:hypothetical protein